MPSTATENARLLNQSSHYGSVEVQDEDTGMISVVTSTGNKSHDDDLLAKRLKGASLMVVLVGLWIGVGLSSLDASIVATIYPQIGTEFKRSNEIVWIATAYMLSYTALQPLYGRVSDALGRRRTILFATIVFFIGSGLCGASNSLWALVISRTIAGVGGGGMNTMSAVITSDLVSLRERGKYQGYANIAYGLGSVIGAPLGGLITDNVGWRYCFYINLPLLLISIYVGIYLLTDYNLEEDASGSTLYQRFKKIDFLGAFFVVISVVCFLVATSLGGNSRAWTDPVVYGLLIASVLMATCFCLVEAKVAQNPLMPWHIISKRTPFASSLVNFFGVMCSFAMTYTTPLFFQGVLGYSSSQAGLFFLPKVIAMSCGSLASGFWMARTGEYCRFITFSALVALISMIGISLWTPDTSLVFIVICLILDGFSSGSLVTTALVSMLSCVNSTDMATITSISYLFRSTGGVIGISVTSAIFQGVVKRVLSERITGPDREAIIEIARKSMNQVREVLPPDALEIVLDTYQVAVSYAFYFCALISLLSVISTLFIQQYQLHSKLK
ncbi:Multidrug resistance protein fnx1 [Choanephora cucurbitarum]|uniref:Multidrug resistance protein fnx1 n=1 Tax=Choanephora cucurbitarum TaxID=101091 RepID=A0A1C7NHZ1_9FUNG|nr:Multidrug resistance protein fnx1 [Choanephora cucurbitarum]